MITYTKEEIISSSTITRSLSDILNKLKNHQYNKIAIVRNNRMEAVIVPLEDYEELMKKADLSEHFEMYNIIKEREKNNIGKAIPFKTILDEYGINIDDL
jgi:prevent-host-death family protein